MNEGVGEDQVAQTVTIAWALSHNRNEIRCGGVRKLGQHLSRKVSDYLMEYRAAVAQNNPAMPLPQQGAS